MIRGMVSDVQDYRINYHVLQVVEGKLYAFRSNPFIDRKAATDFDGGARLNLFVFIKYSSVFVNKIMMELTRSYGIHYSPSPVHNL